MILLCAAWAVAGVVQDDRSFLEPPRVVEDPGPGYQVPSRKFQGIPSLARAPKGRLWAAWYASRSGAEDRNNYVVVATSADDGAAWTDPAFVVDPDGKGPVRGFDPQLWLDPDGRFWLFWAQAIDHDGSVAGVWAMSTDDADAARPRWTEPRRLADGIMMGKPLALSTGEWALPASTWGTEASARVVVSADRGKTWSLRGACRIPPEIRAIDEHMLVERKDGALWLLARAKGGFLAESVSRDGGRTWPEARPSRIVHPAARFFVRRLSSGRLLMVKHHETDGRKRLAALLSDDDGRTWSGGLMLDPRNAISYPDGVEAPDGRIYIVYDRSRTVDREILMAVFTEADVAAGAPGEGTRLRVTVSRAAGDR